MLTFNLKAKMLLGKSLPCPISVLPVDQSPSKVNRSISESSKYSSDDFLQWGHTVRRHATCMNEYQDEVPMVLLQMGKARVS